jgi:hypothetical protein
MDDVGALTEGRGSVISRSSEAPEQHSARSSTVTHRVPTTPVARWKQADIRSLSSSDWCRRGDLVQNSTPGRRR